MAFQKGHIVTEETKAKIRAGRKWASEGGGRAVKLATLCLCCNYPFGQGDHSHCLGRLRCLKHVGDQRLVRAQVFYLAGQRYRSVAVKTCWCGETYRWKASQCKAHTRAWVNRYGGRLRTRGREQARLAPK